MKRTLGFAVGWVMAAIALGSCQSGSPTLQSSAERMASRQTVTVDPTKVVMGQTLYVPIYSHVYHYNSQENAINLSATLSIRNTDLKHSITITSVRYYGTEGQLIRQDVTQPIELKPLASTDFFIAADDTSGGSGANFIVEWVADQTVYEPIIEAVMVSTSSSQGISFVSPGKVLTQYRKPK